METKPTKQSNLSHARSILWIVALASLATAFPAAADDVEFGFAVGMGAFTSDEGNAIAVDASGNVYTTGFFDGTVDFDPGAGTLNLTSAGTGGGDIFVQKLDAIGNLVWAKAMGGTSIDVGYGIALDDSGNVYTTGYFAGTVDFDPGAGTANLTSVGGDDIFVQMLDSSGTFVWARAIGGTATDEGLGITVDASSNVYITGSFQGTVDFDPGAGTANITAVDLSDIFVEKLNSSGEYVWAKAVGGAGSNFGSGIAVDTSGNVYTTGSFESTADFDPGAGTVDLTSLGGGDIFVQKLDSSGNLVWAKAVGGTSTDEGIAITVDVSGNVYSTGYFAGTADFDPGAGTADLSSAGGDDIFVQKLDSSGNFVWANAMGGPSGDQGNGIALDVSGNVYTTGLFAGTADFDPGAGTANLTSAGSFDIFVSKLDSSGNFVWAKAMGGTGGEGGSGIAVDPSGNVYTTGFFLGNTDFDPGADTAILTSADSRDIFVSKLVNPPVVTAIIRVDTNPSNALSLNFEVVFSTPVFGVDVKDFGIDPSGVTGASVTDLTGSDANYTVTVSTGTGDGTLGLVVFDDESIVDSLEVPLGGTGANNGEFSSGEAYTIDKTAPVITLTDPNTITVEAGGSYIEPGATAMDGLDGEVMVTVGGDTVDSNATVDTVFTVTYDAVDATGNNAIQKTRQVTVVDMTAPIITVTNPGVTAVEAGGLWMEPGATVLDGVDGTFAATVGGDMVNPNAPVGTVFIVTYDAVDLAGNDPLQATREVTVVDTTPPNIVLTDPGLTSVEAGGSWSEPGAMAVDIADGDPSPLSLAAIRLIRAIRWVAYLS